MRQITLEELHSATGSGVRVLIVDSGVETRHPALENAKIRCFEIVRANAVYRVGDDLEGNDAYGHGTAVAAILYEHASGAVVESLRVLGSDLRSSSQMVLAGLRWAVTQGYDIVNCSFGTSNAQFVPQYKEIVDLAFCRNVLIVSACNNCNFRQVEYPACFPTVISTDYGNLDGLTLLRRRGELVEFVARGEEIRVAWKGGGYREGTGSSYAAPHLTAAVARVRQLEPSWNACEIKAALYALTRAVRAPSVSRAAS